MVVPHSPFLLALLGRVNSRVQTVHLEGVTAAAVVALMEFIYTGACIVTAQFASEVQQVFFPIFFLSFFCTLFFDLGTAGAEPASVPSGN